MLPSYHQHHIHKALAKARPQPGDLALGYKLY